MAMDRVSGLEALSKVLEEGNVRRHQKLTRFRHEN